MTDQTEMTEADFDHVRAATIAILRGADPADTLEGLDANVAVMVAEVLAELQQGADRDDAKH